MGVKGAETRLDVLGCKWNTGNVIGACRQYTQRVQIWKGNVGGSWTGKGSQGWERTAELAWEPWGRWFVQKSKEGSENGGEGDQEIIRWMELQGKLEVLEENNWKNPVPVGVVKGSCTIQRKQSGAVGIVQMLGKLQLLHLCKLWTRKAWQSAINVNC